MDESNGYLGLASHDPAGLAVLYDDSAVKRTLLHRGTATYVAVWITVRGHFQLATSRSLCRVEGMVPATVDKNLRMTCRRESNGRWTLIEPFGCCNDAVGEAIIKALSPKWEQVITAPR